MGSETTRAESSCTHCGAKRQDGQAAVVLYANSVKMLLARVQRSPEPIWDELKGGLAGGLTVDRVCGLSVGARAGQETLLPCLFEMMVRCTAKLLPE